MTIQIRTYLCLKDEEFEGSGFHSCYLIHELSEVRCIAEWNIFGVEAGNGILDVEVYSIHKAKSISNGVNQLATGL
jgi:hypothetical protein